MFLYLRIENLALVEQAELDCGPGLNVLTGETGAGKTVILEALALLAGEKANYASVRSGASRACVEATCDLGNRPGIQSWLDARGLLSEDPGELVIRREIPAKGRGRVSINGHLATVGQLAELGRLICAFHGQHDSHGLAEPSRQRDLFDAVAEAGPHRRSLAEAWQVMQDTRERLESLDRGERDVRQRLDFLRFQIDEIETVSPETDEVETLRRERDRLAHVEALRESLQRVEFLLGETTPDTPCAMDILGEGQAALEDASEMDESLLPLATDFAETVDRLTATSREIGSYLSRLEADPARLEEIENRLADIRRLERKYGEGTETIQAALEEMKREAEELTSRDTRREELADELRQSEQELLARAGNLARARAKAQPGFVKRLQALLRELAMPRARFEVRIEPIGERHGIEIAKGDGDTVWVGPNGSERVEFYFSANPGEEPKPVREVASGGELSRLMLAFHAVLARRGELPVLVFDEIDSGIGGEAARRVGEVLATLSEHHQVFCVTHQPTIASRAARHFVVSKVSGRRRTVTRVVSMEGEDRRRELARLLDGAASAKSLELAGEMLQPA